MNEILRIGSIEISPERPTELQFADVRDWVIWQFPRSKGGWLCGAVHPPIAEYGWLPAKIHPAKQCLHILTHGTKPFATPEEAADWLVINGK